MIWKIGSGKNHVESTTVMQYNNKILKRAFAAQSGNIFLGALRNAGQIR
jgi:hypothetical protein